MFYRVTNTIMSPTFDKLMTAEEVSNFFNAVMRANEYGTWKIDDVVVDEAMIASIESMVKAPQTVELHAVYRKYPQIGEQLDALYKDIMNGTLDSTGEFATLITAVKSSVAKTEETYVENTVFESEPAPEENTDSEYVLPDPDAIPE